MGEEEEWLLKDVVFLEDTRPVPIGEVLAVDGDQVVIMPYKDGAATKSTSNNGVPSNLRVIHRDQLSVVRGVPQQPSTAQCAMQGTSSSTGTSSSGGTTSSGGTSSPRAPDCYQRSAKRVPLPDSDTTLLAVAVDNRGECIALVFFSEFCITLLFEFLL